MKVHVIIDFMHIYYKYYFQVKGNKIKKLSTALEWNGVFVEKDISLIYYSLKDIESIRRQMIDLGHDTTVSICFDSPSKRHNESSEANKEYKASRENRLSQEDFDNLNYIKEALKTAGYNVYKLDGYEADDLVNYLIRKYKNEFDYNLIYTNDKDLLINIDNNVGVMRFKTGKGYTRADRSKYEQYLESEFKVFIPYNALGLYLASVGDSADNIKGINKFGPKAFQKLIIKLGAGDDIKWDECGDYNKLHEVVKLCSKYLTEEQYKQLHESFLLVSNIELDEDLAFPNKKSTTELREIAYKEMNMLSLI